MIKTLKLSCFRQHIDRTFEFGLGINAIRGANEAGKSSMLLALNYLWFGARALPQSLEETVTYHQPVSKLRVEGTMTHLGVEYSAYRAKSGAEVTFGKERITGQTEVTKFFEQLFGANAEMAGKLMIASQRSLAESLKAGPTAAGKMIEDLANFDLIDRVATTIAEKLPAGVTTAVESRIAMLREQAEPVETTDLSELEMQVSSAEKTVAAAYATLDAAKSKRADLDLDLAKSILADEKRLQAVVLSCGVEVEQLRLKLAVAPEIEPTEAETAALRASVTAEGQYDKILAADKALKVARVEALWDGALPSLELEVELVTKRISAFVDQVADHDTQLSAIKSAINTLVRETEVKVATLQGKIIRETTCPLCQKDLKDVPEVTAINAKARKDLAEVVEASAVARAALDLQLAEKEAVRKSDADLLATDRSTLAELVAVVKRNLQVEAVYSAAADYITVERGTVPGTWIWTGPDTSLPKTDSKPALAKLETAQLKAAADRATRIAQEEHLKEVELRRDIAVLEHASLQVVDAAETVQLAAGLDLQVSEALVTLRSAEGAHQSAQGQLSIAVALQKQAQLALALAQKNLAAAETELADMQRNNALIRKVRSARPVITDKLWSIVLAGVSKYFSEVRDAPSSITRSDGMFKYNSYPVAGLSGSAEDMLGLSMRIALTKTFLPGIGFLLLDEPGSACSDSRETMMLGMLSTLKFDQILMVTHSNLVDSFAQNVITI